MQERFFIDSSDDENDTGKFQNHPDNLFISFDLIISYVRILGNPIFISVLRTKAQKEDENAPTKNSGESFSPASRSCNILWACKVSSASSDGRETAASCSVSCKFLFYLFSANFGLQLSVKFLLSVAKFWAT